MHRNSSVTLNTHSVIVKVAGARKALLSPFQLTFFNPNGTAVGSPYVFSGRNATYTILPSE